MDEYENLGHMIRSPESHDQSRPHVYIPHHPVLRADSLTSRIRVVFNASSLTSNGTSLNDHLLAGPKLQTELPAIILRWRQFRFVYSANIAKMYRQSLIDSRDTNYQRILWHSGSSQTPDSFRLLTVTYGMICAPFLALRVLKRLAEDEGNCFPRAVPVLTNHVYVDDVLFGGHDINELRQIHNQLIALLRCGGFELRKWVSNNSVLLTDIDSADHELACSKSLAPENVKVLGIAWNPSHDNFHFHVNLDDSVPTSKRTILSNIARLYDPLGWVTVIISAKIFMQQLWRCQLEWDDPIPPNISPR